MVIKIYQWLINPRVCKMSLLKFQASDCPDVADSPNQPRNITLYIALYYNLQGVELTSLHYN